MVSTGAIWARTAEVSSANAMASKADDRMLSRSFRVGDGSVFLRLL
jgi:hypothetical protein